MACGWWVRAGSGSLTVGERSRVRTVWAVVTAALAAVTGFVVVAGLVITSGTSGECFSR